MITVELLRVVRHGVAPLIIWVVEEGWLPEAAQSDVVEFIAILVSLGLAYGWSWWNERKRDRISADEQSDRSTDTRGTASPTGPEGEGLAAKTERSKGG